jgi:hypothetical protein
VFLFHFWDSDFPKPEGDCAPPSSANNHNQQGWNELVAQERAMARQVHKASAVMKTCTYNLILASELEDRGRSVAEMLIYALFILSAVAAIISAAAQPVVMLPRVAANDCKTEYCG